MPSYVAFLRAINLGARRKFAKDDIRACVESVGASDVATHINTGNVRFTTSMRSRPRIEAMLEETFRADRGFDVPTIVYTTAELTRLGADVAELHARRDDLERHYVLLLKDDPTPAQVAEIEALGTGGVHEARVRNRAVHLLLGPGYEDGKVDPLRVEPHLGICTNRSHTVITALARKWGA